MKAMAAAHHMRKVTEKNMSWNECDRVPKSVAMSASL
jgi:hypothetical protein